MEDSQYVSDRDTRDLWARGKFWEVFGFSGGDFTTLELAKQYSLLTKAYHDSPDIIQIIDETFATLNAPLTRQFYEGCRMLMRRINRQIGSAAYHNAEHRIWHDLWSWVSERWIEPPEELIKAIENTYRHSRGTGAATTRGEAPIEEGSWFERHLNWSGVLVGLATPLLGSGVYVLAIYLLIEGRPPGIAFFLGIALLVATGWSLFWLLKKKQRSWSWSLLVFVPYIGWFVFIAVYLALKNRSQTF